MGVEFLHPGVAVLLPERRGALPGGLDGAAVSGCRRLVRLDAQVRLAQVRAQALAQPLWGDLLLGQQARPGRIGGGQLAAPGIGQQRVDQFAVVGGQFAVEVAAGLERGILQGTLAEAVDGEHRSLVEAMHGEQQAPARGVVGKRACRRLRKSSSLGVPS
ncbi:hypothetical protein SSTU70S_00270 [Stutzerimonas stutzeri]